MPNKIFYNQDQLQGDLQDIIRQITLDDFKPDVIVGIARGGLIPSTMLSHFYDKPLMIINLSFRDDKVRKKTNDIDVISNFMKDSLKKVLVVDDICDSGVTLCKVMNQLSEGWTKEAFDKNCKTAVLWSNTSQNLVNIDYVGREISRCDDERWVIFPYEEWWKAR